MKKSLLLLMTLTPLMAFSQVIDYDIVNQRNADRINSEYAATQAQKRSKIAKFFTIDKTDFPKVESYSRVEKDQINLLSCTRDFVQKYKGGYDGPAIAQKILLSAMDGASLSTDSDVLNKAEKTCHEAYKKLYNFKKKAINESVYSQAIGDLPRSTEAEVKTADVIRSLNDKTETACKVVSVGAEAYLLIGGGVGVNSIKCLRSDARVVKYVGVDGRFGGGVGASVNMAVNPNAKAGDVFAVYNSVYDVDLSDNLYYATGLSHLGGSNESEEIMNLGLSANFTRLKGGIGLRVFNGKARWSILLNALK